MQFHLSASWIAVLLLAGACSSPEAASDDDGTFDLLASMEALARCEREAGWDSHVIQTDSGPEIRIEGVLTREDAIAETEDSERCTRELVAAGEMIDFDHPSPALLRLGFADAQIVQECLREHGWETSELSPFSEWLDGTAESMSPYVVESYIEANLDLEEVLNTCPDTLGISEGR